MVAAAVIGGVATVAGGVMTASAGSKAANAQKDAAAQAAQASQDATNATVAEQRRQYDQTREDYAPYRETGYAALGKLAGLYGVGDTKVDPTAELEATPGYQFTRDQGLQAIDRANAARGILNSGGADKARMRYASGVASSTYDSYASRLAQLAGVGQSATGATTAAGENASNAITAAYGNNGRTLADAYTAAGNATASSYKSTASAINGSVNNLANIYLRTQGFGSPTSSGTGVAYGGTLGGIY